MSTAGIVYRDLTDTPEAPADGRPFPFTSSANPRTEVKATLAAGDSDSHALATADHDEKGVAQLSGPGLVDLGWHEPDEHRPQPLIGRLPNEQLWLLIRRFNKQMYCVKETHEPVPGGLDLNIADEDEFSPDKLRSTVERLYMTVIISFMGGGKHIVRLRSWRETERTAWFCTAYFTAWFFNLLVPLFTATLMALIVYPPSRTFLFPPAPLALVDGKTGGVQKPKAGVLGSHDSATGAPENHKGEAVEQEASNFVNSLASVVLSSVSGKHPQNDPPSAEEGKAQDLVPDPTSMAVSAADARHAADGKKGHHDKTKVPMETAMWNKMRPIMHGIQSVADYWERFANALSPTPPFPRDKHRIRLAALVAPLFFMSLFVTSYMFMKGLTFGIGFGFFGDPIIQPSIRLLNEKFPNWKKLLELRNNILRGVPTNAQLTITLLRIGEANKAPLPPPPRSHQPPPDQPAKLTDEHLRSTGAEPPLNASAEELDAAISHDPHTAHETSGADVAASKHKAHGRKGSKVLGFLKGTARATVEAALGADKLRAKVGDEHAKNRLGAIAKPGEEQESGPVVFKCRYHGKKGHAYIPPDAAVPYVAFSTDDSIERLGIRGRDVGALGPVWEVPIAEIAELKKVGGFGWKAKMVIGWVLDKEVADGLEIVDRRGNTWAVTACLLRDELFNRLVAIGPQKWESW